ncbi:MAG: DUF3369 domain-containing protein [Tissierellia bacterium]|mgnify:FL=1|nr:DUF3369 domain-containing protein [Tissierellia bacterium]
MVGKEDGKGWFNSHNCWKILIIDRDNFTHIMAREMVKDIKFQNKSFRILSAYSSAEALEILSQNKGVALIIVDPFTDDDSHGLKIIKDIREVMGNSVTRIVIITNIKSNKLKKETMLNYDINGYEQKTSVLSEKFLTIVIPAIKSYRDIIHINNNKKAMEQIASSSTNLIEVHSIKGFMKSVFCHISTIINLCTEDDECNINGISAIKSLDEKDFLVTAGFGKYKDCTDNCISKVLLGKDFDIFQKAYIKKDQIILKDRYVAYYGSSSGIEGIVFIETKGEINHIDIKLLDVFHKNISAAFESLCLNREIEETQREVLYTLGEVTEARSEETGNHVKRVSMYSKILAEKYGLSKRDTRLITMAAPIHDVGKVAIPDSILMKPGRLSSEEFETIKTHTTIGYNLLKRSNREVLKSAAIIAHEHHERYDGKGYPRGLKGKEIHIFGRIVSIADVFDALGSQRVYKKGWATEDILNYFHQERGKHFDPDLVDILFDNLDEFIEIKEKYSDKNPKVIRQVSDNNNER